jgi:SAM-dependent methyltransferase
MLRENRCSTVNIDPGSFLEPFARYLAPGATILDVGCGSGRDLRWFAKRGFASTGFENSPGLARLARQHAACPVIEGDFQDYDFSQLSYSGLVFVGSLVHLSHADFPVLPWFTLSSNENSFAIPGCPLQPNRGPAIPPGSTSKPLCARPGGALLPLNNRQRDKG